MLEREKLMIKGYLPSPPDESLGDFEYYVKRNERVYKVEIANIFPNDEDTLYEVVTVNKRVPVRGWRESGAFSMSDLYDNKEDCRNDTHPFYDNWEYLRKIQKEEKEGFYK